MPPSKKIWIYYGGDVPEVYVFGEKVAVVNIVHMWVTKTESNPGNELLTLSYYLPSDSSNKLHTLSYNRNDTPLIVDNTSYSDFEIITSAK